MEQVFDPAVTSWRGKLTSARVPELLRAAVLAADYVTEEVFVGAFAEEQALGLHSKGRKAGGHSAAREKLRVQTVKASHTEDPQTQHCEQIGLGL